LQEYVQGCNDYLLRKVLKVSSDNELLKQERIVSLSYLIRGLAYFSAPLMPDFSQRVWETLGNPGQVRDQPWDDVLKRVELELNVGVEQDWFTPMAHQLLVK
jgi:methionyl-tRNA synthetase